MNITSSPGANHQEGPALLGRPAAMLELACGLEAILVGLLQLIADRLCLPDRLTAPFMARLDRAMQRLKRHLAALAAGQPIPQRSQRPSRPPPIRRPLGLLERLYQKTVFHGSRLVVHRADPAPAAETPSAAPMPRPPIPEPNRHQHPPPHHAPRAALRPSAPLAQPQPAQPDPDRPISFLERPQAAEHPHACIIPI